MLRAFLKDSAIYSVPTLVSRGLALLLIPLYTRVLTPGDYGSLDLFTVFAGIINLTIALEVSQAVARFYTSEDSPVIKVLYASTALWFTMMCYTAFALLTLSCSSLLSDVVLGQPAMESAFQIGIIYIWANGIFYLIQNQFRWELRAKQYAIVSLLMSFVTAGVSLWFVYGLSWGLEGLLGGMAIGCLISAAIGLWWLRASFQLRFALPQLREMLAFSTPLVFSGVAVWISLYVDRVMINHYLSVQEVGVYGIGYRVASISSLVMTGFQGALTPLVYAHYRDANTPNQLARIFRLFLAFALLIFLGLSLFSREIVHILTTTSFYDASAVVIYLVPALLLANMYIFAPGISIAKRTHYFIWINIGGAVLNFGLNAIFIPALGIVGAGIATASGYLAVFCIHMIISQRLYYVPHNWLSTLSCVVLAMAIALWLPTLDHDPHWRWWLNFFAILLFSGFMIAAGLIRPSELRQGIQLVRNSIARQLRSPGPPELK